MIRLCNTCETEFSTDGMYTSNEDGMATCYRCSRDEIAADEPEFQRLISKLDGTIDALADAIANQFDE